MKVLVSGAFLLILALAILACAPAAPFPTATPVVSWQRFSPRPYYSIDLPADWSVGTEKEKDGFALDAFYEVSPIAYRARYRYSRDGKGLICDDLEGYGLYILQSVRMFVINPEVCADWAGQ